MNIENYELIRTVTQDLFMVLSLKKTKLKLTLNIMAMKLIIMNLTKRSLFGRAIP